MRTTTAALNVHGGEQSKQRCLDWMQPQPRTIYKDLHFGALDKTMHEISFKKMTPTLSSSTHTKEDQTVICRRYGFPEGETNAELSLFNAMSPGEGRSMSIENLQYEPEETLGRCSTDHWMGYSSRFWQNSSSLWCHAWWTSFSLALFWYLYWFGLKSQQIICWCRYKIFFKNSVQIFFLSFQSLKSSLNYQKRFKTSQWSMQ